MTAWAEDILGDEITFLNALGRFIEDTSDTISLTSIVEIIDDRIILLVGELDD